MLRFICREAQMLGEEVLDEDRLAEEQIADLTERFQSRWRQVRHVAVQQLTGVDFEQFERPPELKLLLIAMNEGELRERAIASLVRVLRGMDEGTTKLDSEHLRLLRNSLALAEPHLHPDFLTAATNILLNANDIEAIPELGELEERSTIAYKRVRRTRGRYLVEERTVPTFEGSPGEVRNMRTVCIAAQHAIEELKQVAARVSRGETLLRAVHTPEAIQLLRPASSSTTPPEHLMRPVPNTNNQEMDEI